MLYSADELMNIKGLSLTRQTSWSFANSAWTALPTSWNAGVAVPFWLHSVSRCRFLNATLVVTIKQAMLKAGYG